MTAPPGIATTGGAVLLILVALSGCVEPPPADPAPTERLNLAPAEAAEERRARAWWAVERATRSCMRSEGFDDYALVPEHSGEPGPSTAEAWLAGLPEEERQTASDALFGPRDEHGRAFTDGLAGHELWRATGCHGRALHEVGAD